jgi:hypothetical protein
MTDFQFTAASLAIILEAFSEEAERPSSLLTKISPQISKLKQMQTRIAAGEFWDHLGGLVQLELKLKAGFSEMFPFRYNNETGAKELVEFPSEVATLFSKLRSCGISADSLKDPVSKALPYLRAFLEGKSAP